MAKDTQKQTFNDSKAEIETGKADPAVEFNEDGSVAATPLPIDTASAPVNHVQTDEFYELQRVSNEVAKPAAPAAPSVPVVALESANVEEHKTGLPSNTTGGQLDLAIDRFHAQQEKDIPAAKLDLLARLRILEQEAEAFVKEKIDAIRAAL